MNKLQTNTTKTAVTWSKINVGCYADYPVLALFLSFKWYANWRMQMKCNLGIMYGKS